MTNSPSASVTTRSRNSTRNVPQNDEKELVLVFVVMPHELALEFDELHLLPVQLTDDLGPPVLVRSATASPRDSLSAWLEGYKLQATSYKLCFVDIDWRDDR